MHKLINVHFFVVGQTWGKEQQNIVFIVGNACPWPENLLTHKNLCNHPNMSTLQLQGYRNEIMEHRIREKNITMRISKEKRDVKIVDVVDTPIYREVNHDNFLESLKIKTFINPPCI